VLADDYSGDAGSGAGTARAGAGEPRPAPDFASGTGDASARTSVPEERITEEEAIAALSASTTARVESARALDIISGLLRRMGDDPALRVGSINVFNDKIRIDEGDLSIGAGPRGAPATMREREPVLSLTEAYIEHRTLAYVRPPGFSKALDILRGRNLLVLCGPRGTGREAAALALLSLAAAARELKQIASTALLADRGWHCGPAGTGFLVRLDEAGVAGRLDDGWLHRTAARLREADNYMVVVTGGPSGSLATATGRADFLCEELGLPDAAAVLRRRAQAMVSPARMRALDRALAGADVAELLIADDSPSFAARAAVLLAQALNDGRDTSSVVRTLRNPTGQVQDWFDLYDGAEETDYRQLVLPIAVSVLEDSSYLAVTDAATMLYQRLFPEEDGPPPLRFRRSLREHQQWIQLAEAAEDGAALDGAQSELLRFRSPLLRPAVLHYTWTWLDGIRPALVGWMGDLVAHRDVDVRTRTAAAAGLLATLDFSYVLQQFLYPWAVGGSIAKRTCAALALAIPGSSPRHEDRVWALLGQWATEPPGTVGRRLACAAAEAVGGVLGRDRPRDAFAVLHEVLKRDEWESLTQVVLAVLHLAENGCAVDVLTALAEWTEPDDGSAPVIKALAAFAITARTPPFGEAPARTDLATRADGAQPPARGRSRLTGTAVASLDKSVPARPDSAPRSSASASWPALLQVADKRPNAVRDLWGRALAAKPVRPLALDALRDWLELADRDSTALDPVSRVIRSVAGLGGKHPERIEYYLDRWAHDPRQPVRAAQWLLS
jgi:hypothetical protein